MLDRLSIISIYLFQKLIATPALISLASGFAVNAAEINSFQ
jgi:hypothetical protein